MSDSGSFVLRQFLAAQREEWDAFICEHAKGHLLQSWDWGELKAGPTWRPLRLALCAGDSGRIVAAAQVLQRTAWHLPAYCGHLAYIPRGPVLDWQASVGEGESLPRLFLSGLRAFLHERGALALQVEPHLEVTTAAGQSALAVLRELGFYATRPVQPVRTIVLDIRPDEEALLAGMREKWRYNVRLAMRRGVEVSEARTREDLQAWYTLLAATGERARFGIHTFAYYQKIWQVLGPRQRARLFVARAQGELLAGVFVGLLGREAIYLYGASSDVQRNLMPNYLLQWEAIRWARKAGATSYDFWGIPATEQADEAMAGVYRFKSGWGGRVVCWPGNYEYVYHPLIMRGVRALRRG
ncbi:MAG TPA: peptidoglycan bridge formation glycyltransferase FemA/FemB family protein [Ktedonobacteraceae bacterium]